MAINDRGRIVCEILALWEKAMADPGLEACKKELEIASTVLRQTFTTDELYEDHNKEEE